MAAVTHAITTPSTSNATSYASGSFTPVAGDLLVVFVRAGATVATGTMTDSQGLGFTKVGSATFATSTNTIYCFVANNLAAATAMTVTFDCTGDAADGAVIHVARVSGMPRAGASAVRQSAKTDNGAAAATPAPAFASAASSGNPTLGCVGNGANPATMTPPVSWTEQSDSGYSTPTSGSEFISRDFGFTGTTITWGSASATTWGAFIVELDALPVPQKQIRIVPPVQRPNVPYRPTRILRTVQPIVPRGWWKADAITSPPADGGALQDWTDSSGNGFTASQATSGNQPTYRTSGAFLPNGLPCVEFSAASSTRVAATLSQGGPTTRFMVARLKTMVASTSYCVASSPLQAIVRDGGLWSGIENVTFLSQDLSASMATGNWYILTVADNGTDANAVYINGVLKDTDSTVHTNTGTGLTIGSKTDGFEPFDGYLAEVIDYPAELSATDRDAVVAYLAAKYSIGTQSAAVAMAGSNALAISVTGDQAATVAMAGSNSLAVTGSQTQPASVAMAGSNSLSVSPLVTHPATVAMAGSNSLSVTGQQTIAAVVAMAGSNALAVTGLQTISSAIAMAGANGLSVTGQQTISATVAMAGNNTLSVTPLVTHPAVVAMAGSNALAVTGLQTISSTVAMAGANALSVSGQQTIPAAVAMAGSNALGVSGLQTISATVSMAGSNSLAITATVGTAVAMAGSNSLSVSPLVTHPATVAMAGSNSLSVTGQQTIAAVVAMAGSNALAVTGLQTISSAIAMAGANGLSVSGLQVISVTLAMAGSNTLAISVTGQQAASVAMAGSNSLSVSPLVTHPATFTHAGVNSVSITGLQTLAAALAMAGSNTLAVGPLLTHDLAISLAGANSLSVTGRQTIPATVSMAGGNTLSVTVTGQQSATVAMAGSNTLSVAVLVAHIVTVAMAGSNSLAVATSITRAATVAMAGDNTLSIAGRLILSYAVAMAGSNMMAIVATFRFIEVAITTGSGRYGATTGGSRYQVTTGAARYRIEVS